MGVVLSVTKKPRRRTYGKLNITFDRATLAFGSNPIQTNYELSIEHIEAGKRRVLCRRQVQCVTLAASEKWISFSCAECAVRDRLTPDQCHRDLEGLTRLLRELNLTARRRPRR